MLLITEALLILAALGQDHRAAAAEQIFPLDMALDSVDDYYYGCREEMANLVEKEYLKMEIDNSAKFKYYWEYSENIVKFPKDHLTRNQLIAVHMYTGKYIYREFNDETRYGKNDYKQMKYKWYSLHFLLTVAIQILRKTQNKCYFTYRGTTANFDKHVLNKQMRFGSYTSSSLDRKVTQDFGSKSCFEIYTCESAELTKYSQYPYIKEVLIPPYERFKVTAVKTRKNDQNLWCDIVFSLKSTGIVSYQNCALVKKPKKTYVSH